MRSSLLLLLVTGVLAACAPAGVTQPVGPSPSPLTRTARPGDIVLTDADNQPMGAPPRVVQVGQTIAVILTVAHDTSRGVFLSSQTPGTYSPLPANPDESVPVSPLTALGGDRFHAIAAGRAVLAAQVAHSLDAAPLVWRVEVVVQQ